MAFEVGDVEHAGVTGPGVSGDVVHALVTHIRAVAGEVGLAQALALAAEDRSFRALGDVHTWTSLEDAVPLFTAGALVTADNAMALHVGELVLDQGDTAELADRLRALGSPEDALRHVGAVVDHFESAVDAVALEVGPGRALVEVSPAEGSERHAHLCELTRGMLSAIPTVFGQRPARVAEHQCAARGGRSCRYELQWEHAPRAAGPSDGDGRATTPYGAVDPDASIGGNGSTGTNGHGPSAGTPDAHGPGRDLGALEAQLSAAHGALADAMAEAARDRADVERLELLVEETTVATMDRCENDVNALLDELATRADQVFAGRAYLLMVRVGTGLPIEIHHRGLDEDAARTLAGELWTGGGDGTLASPIAVDISSARRRYGRIALFAGSDGVPSPPEERVVRVFARYAANVLDVFTVLGDARRSDSTARTILSFSEELSGLTNLAQALQILADTVPRVTGSTQSTVYLWDRTTSRLVLGSHTSGMAPPDADLGPISPHWSTPRTTTHIRAVARDEDDASDDSDEDGAGESTGQLRVTADDPLIQRMMNGHQVMVLDASTVADPQLRRLMEETGIPASVVAPMFASGEFLGVIAANFDADTAPDAIHDPVMHERLCGLADQAATAIQNLDLLEKVSHMAWHDALTSLPNRRLFEDRVEQELVRSRRVGEPVCMFFVDLDNFKAVNDTHGHAAGDALIQEVSRRLLDTVRSQDTVARVGGDEFAILLPGLVDQLSINQLAQRTLDAIHTPFDIFGELVTTSASVGIAIAPEHGDTYDDLLNRADEAMYRAKDHGRDAFEMFVHSPDPVHPGRRALDDRKLHHDMVDALDRDEFFLVYQPYIDLRTAGIVGVEALIRWQHPTFGVLEPAQFISIAERSDLIVSLDNWVLWQACRQLRTWRDHGMDPLRLSVNLASRDLSNPEFFDSVERTLRDTGIEPSLLEFDITERVVLDPDGPAGSNIDRLRRLGVRFTVDNFGSGNSSLDRIGTFPVSTLKIDRSFVQVLGPEDEENSLVSAIIAMADRLGLSCVAEGVETLLQSRLLLQRGCTTAQGFYFSPPLPPEGIETMLASLTPAEVPESFGQPPRDAQPPEAPGA